MRILCNKIPSLHYLMVPWPPEHARTRVRHPSDLPTDGLTYVSRQPCWVPNSSKPSRHALKSRGEPYRQRFLKRHGDACKGTHLGLSAPPKASWGSRESKDNLMASPPCTGSPAGLLMMSMSRSLWRMLALRCCISASSSISVRRSANEGTAAFQQKVPVCRAFLLLSATACCASAKAMPGVRTGTRGPGVASCRGIAVPCLGVGA